MMELNKVLLADNMDVMREIPDKYFELALIDCPYGIEEDGRNNHTRGFLCKSKDYRKNAQYDNEAPAKEYFEELLRVSQNQIIWGANHFIDRIPFGSPCWIVWDKDNGETDFADCELAWTSFETAVRKFKWRWQGMLQQDMKNKQIRIHPNEKPVALYKWLLKNYAKPGDKILDTHAGSCSSVIACLEMGFQYLAIEKDADYHAAACKRIEQYQSQLKLFPA